MKRASRVLAFVWGFAEAVVFFVVADVAITVLTVRNGFRTGLIASLWATVGALLGGIVVYLWACWDASSVDRMLDLVPAISVGQIAAVKEHVAENWILATLVGGFSGAPYKLYAAAAGEQGLSLLPFLAVSFVARLSRFVCSAMIAQALTWLLARVGRDRWAMPLIKLFWFGFYVWYWSRMPW